MNEDDINVSGTLGMYEMEIAAKRIIYLINNNTLYSDVPIYYKDFLSIKDKNDLMITGLLHLIYRGYVIPSYPNSIFVPSEEFYVKFADFIDGCKNKYINPPFNPGQKITCIKLSKERDWDGSIIDVCRCTKGSEYIIDGCVWSYKAGWLVSISGELHSASDFRVV